MKATIKTEVAITIEMSAEEAEWLRSYMQNSVNCAPEDEALRDREMRERFFKAVSPPSNVPYACPRPAPRA